MKIEKVSLIDAKLDCTYFTSSDVIPKIADDGKSIIVIEGSGTRRGWGAPKVDSDVVINQDDFIQIEVTGWHKHTISPVGGTYYFVRDPKNGNWARKRGNAKIVKAMIERYG